jgi:hypothetical protein
MTTRLARLKHVAGLLGLCCGLVPATSAHHSQSEFDLRGKVEVEGAVTKVDWRSPHAWIYVDVTDAKGEKVNWSFELPSPVTLMRRGWTRDSLKAGDRVTITGAPAKNFPTIAIANFVRDENGKPLFTGTTQVNEVEAETKGR